MKISINEGYFRKKFNSKDTRSFEESITMCKKSGFEAVDFGLGDGTPEQNIALRDNHIEDAEKLKEFCDKTGIEVNQTHARFDYRNIKKEDFSPVMIKTVEVSKILGAKSVVIHADTFYDVNDPELTLNTIYNDYAPMVETAKKLGINIAVENLFEDKNTPVRFRYTSYAEEVDAIVSKFNDPCVGICWDFGHARVAYGDDQFEHMKKLKNKIIATHIHDNYYDKDLHVAPFLGGTNWIKGMDTLKEIGYKGDLTLEIVYGCLPEELVFDYAKLLNKMSRYMLEYMNK